MLAGWLLSAWQVSLGFTLGLQYCYLLLALAALTLVFWWRGRLTPGVAWQRPARRPPRDRPVSGSGSVADEGSDTASRQRPRGPLLPRRLLGVTLAGVAILGAVAVYQARPYLKVAAEYPTAKRTLREVKTYSAGPGRAARSVLGEPRVGLGDGGDARESQLEERERVLPRGADPRARVDRARRGRVHASIARSAWRPV